jgi:hypothetical protein
MAAPSIADVGILQWSEWLLQYSKRHIDPYVVWSVQTKFRQHIPPPSPNAGPELLAIDFLLELYEPIAKGDPKWPTHVKVPEIYFDNLPGGTQPARHVTVRLQVKDMSLKDIMDAVGELMDVEGVRRTQMGFPRPPFDDDKVEGPVPEERRVLASGAGAVKPCAGVVLAVLDDACPFGHPALVSKGKTRVVALWDQSLCKEQPPPSLGYGRERAGDELDCLLDRHRDGDGHDEESLYGDRDALQPRLRVRSAHAAAVVTLLAGRRSLLPVHPASTDPPATEAETVELRDDGDDAASRAPLVVVQFPREQIDLTARWMVVRALDGLRYVACKAEGLKGEKDGPKLPLVANLSYGGVVGAHDGTALLETAMAEMAQAHGRMAIVLAAGNAYGTRRDDGGDAVDALRRQQSGCHATGLLKPNGGTTSLRLCVPPNKPIETYLEMWFEDMHKQHGDEQFLDDHEVRIQAVSPVGKVLKIDLPYADFDDRHPNLTGAGLIGVRRVAQSKLRSMALLVVAATQVSSMRVAVPSGIWLIRVTNRGTRCLRLQAWVERDLLPGLARESQAARLLPGREDDAAELSDDDTLNNIATGEEVIRVGAVTWRSRPSVLGASVYSSAARDDSVGPEFSAVADEAPSLPGIRVSGSISSAIVRMNGTSVAAPQAARYIANRLAHGDSLEQIRADIGHAGGDRRVGRILV